MCEYYYLPIVCWYGLRFNPEVNVYIPGQT